MRMRMTMEQVYFIIECLEDIAERFSKYGKDEDVWDVIMGMCDNEQRNENWSEEIFTIGQNLIAMGPVFEEMAYLKAFVPSWNFVNKPCAYYMEYMVNLYEFLASQMLWLKYGEEADLVGSKIADMTITPEDIKALTPWDIEKFFS